MEAEPQATGNGHAEVDKQNGDAPESEQTPATSDGLLSQDQQELSERVTHLEKRVREQENEIVCLKGALADMVRRVGHVEATKGAQNSVLPSKPFPKSPRRAPSGQERPKSMHSESFTVRQSAPTSARPTPRGASASSAGKKWGSMSNNIDETNGHKSPRHGAQLTHSNKEPQWQPESQSVRMYLAGRPVSLYPSSDVTSFNPQSPQDKPDQKLQLEWVYGYRGRDARSNLYTLPTGECLYFTAGVIVLHNFQEETQRFYMEHTDDIKCIAVHPDQVKIASGQVAGHDKKEGKPHVRIWDSVTLSTLHVLGEGDFQRGVCCVGFSKYDGGKLLLAVDESNDHNLSVWDISKNHPKKVSECKSSGDPVTQCEFHPTEENSIVLCGKSNISFWSLNKSTLNKKMGIFEKNEKPAVVICFTFASNGDVVTGDSNGTIYVWSKGSNKVSQAVTGAHDGAIFSLCMLPEEDGIILSGGKDRKIYQWNDKYEKIDGEAELPEAFGSVRMLSPANGKELFVGTIRNCILKFSMDGGAITYKDVLVQGHVGELWGLETHPTQSQFLTCSYDKSINLWDSASHSLVWTKEISFEAHCCCIHPDESLAIAVVGLRKPKMVVVDLNTHETLNVYTDGAEQVECIAFSPDGTKLAAGNRDNRIYVYKVSEDGKKYSKIGRCSGHSSYVTHIDWDTTGKIIRSNSGDYECLYWNAETCKQEPDKDDVKDLQWATNSCTLSFNTIGIWPEGADGTDVNNCTVSHDGRLVVSADDFGFVSLFSYPCVQPKAEAHMYQGHSSHVTMAKFMKDDSRVITLGGNDCTILQWKVE